MKDMQDAVVQDPTLIPDKKSMKSYLPHNRHMVIDYPGVANVRVGNVSIPGNRIIVFGPGVAEGLHPDDYDELRDQAGDNIRDCSSADLFNLYFLHRANLIITDWKMDVGGNIAVMITTQLDKEQVDDMTEVQQVVNDEMAKRRQAREDEKAKAEEKQEALEQETRRKLLLAEKAEKQGWENRIKELEDLNAKLSKDIKALKKASK